MLPGRLIEDERGQGALFDAVIYLVIMIAASGMIAVFSGQYVRDAELSENQDMTEYCRDTSTVVFGATLNATWYEDVTGNVVFKPPGDTRVLGLLLEEMHLLCCGVPPENFALGLERDITILVRNLVTPNYHFAVEANYECQGTGMTTHIFISDIVPLYQSKEAAREDTTNYSGSIPKSNLVSVHKTLPMIERPGNVGVTFSLWI